jgi:hypothetical protein
MLHRRLRTLPPAARALAADAAGLAPPFADRVWFEAAELTRDQAELAARELRRREVVERAGPGRSRFVHASVPEVLGVALGRRARRARHRRLALALERHEPGAAAAIAGHWRAAREPLRAAGWYRALARDAAQAGRSAEAESAEAAARACEVEATGDSSAA